MRSLVKSPRVPQGYYFKVHMECDCFVFGKSIEIELYHKNSRGGRYPIGSVTLQPCGKTASGIQKWETHSGLSSLYWNKKLGVTMYVRAIKWCLDRGYNVQSSISTSELAQRVWNGKTIRKYVRIIKRKHTYEYGATYTWHAYPKQGTK